MHPDRHRDPAKQFAQAGGEFVQRDVHGAVDVAGRPFERAPDVQDRDAATAPGGGEAAEAGHRTGGRVLAAQPVREGADGGPSDPVHADPGQLPLRGRDLARGAGEQGQPGAVRQQPAELGGERVAEREAERTGHVPGRESQAAAQVHHPVPGRDPPRHLAEQHPRRWQQGGSVRAERVRLAHPCVVRGEHIQAGQHGGDVAVPVHGQRRVRARLLGECRDPSRARGRGPGRAEAAGPVRRVHRRVPGQQCSQPARRGVLGRRQRGRVPGAEQIGAPGRSVQQRATGEDACHLSGAGIGHDIGQVGPGVAGGGDGPHPHGARLDHVPVADRRPRERHVIGTVHVIDGAGLPGQGQAAGDVVVVDVRLEDMGHRHAAVGGQHQDPVDVTLRIHHERGRAVGHQVTAVTQRRRVDHHNLDHGGLLAFALSYLTYRHTRLY